MATNLESIKFHDDFLEVVSIAGTGAVGKIDNEYLVSVRKVCENLHIHIDTQFKKLKSDPTFEARLLKVPTPGGIQEVFCIPLEKLNGWLFTINPNKVKPEVKQKLIAYKKECFKVLYDHFVAKAAQANALPAQCQSELITPQIMAYKSNLAKQRKKIEELRWELAAYKNEVEELRARKDPEAWFKEHNLLDLSCEMARHNQLLKSAAQTLEIIAKDLHQSADHADHFLNHIIKHYPKAKDAVEHVRKHFRRFYG